MQKGKKILALVLALVMLSSAVIFGVNASTKITEDDGQWVSAWSTSMVNASIDDLFAAVGATGVSDFSQKIGLSLLKNVVVSLDDISCRSTIQPTIGGQQIRLTLSNKFGTNDVVIERMTAAKSQVGSENKIDRGTIKPVTVNGTTILTIPKGETITTDPIDLPVNALDSVAFTIYLRDKNAINTVGLIGGDSYIKRGDQTQTETISNLKLQYTGDFGEYSVIPFITDLQVLTDAQDNASACVLIGDSTIANDIPIYLSEKLQKNGINVSILQEAIKGNEVTQDGKGTIGHILGESMEHRFQRDVFEHEGVKYVIVKVGDNDIVHSRCTSLKDEYAGCGDSADGGISAEQVIKGYQVLLDMLAEHNKGLNEDDQIKIYFVSRSPWKGYTRNLFNKEDGDDIQWTPEIANECVKINQWLKGAADGTNSDDYTIDGFIDMSIMEEGNTGALREGYTPDGVHFTATAQKVFADIIPLSIFKDGSCTMTSNDFYYPELSEAMYNSVAPHSTVFYGTSVIPTVPDVPVIPEGTTEPTEGNNPTETTEPTEDNNPTETTKPSEDNKPEDNDSESIVTKITNVITKVTDAWAAIKELFSGIFKK